MRVSGILLFALLVLIALASMLDVTEAGSSVANKDSSVGNKRNVVVNDDDDDDDEDDDDNDDGKSQSILMTTKASTV
jgi:hypothetical protein